VSRAFVKEDSPDDPVVLPDKPISSLKNYVTPEGYSWIQSRVEELQQKLHSLVQNDDQNDGMANKNRRAELSRDLRYFRNRAESAEIIEVKDTSRVRFGHRVELTDENDQTYLFHIVGEDEADVSKNKICWASPLAMALIGKTTGETCFWKKSDIQLEIEITSIQ